MEISRICGPDSPSALPAPCCIFSFELFRWSLSLRYDVMVRIPLFYVEASPPYSSLTVLAFTTEYYWCWLGFGYFLAWYSSFKEGRLSKRSTSFKVGSLYLETGRQSTEYWCQWLFRCLFARPWLGSALFKFLDFSAVCTPS